MPTYVVLFNWTDQGIRSYKDSPARYQAARAGMAQAGVDIRQIYWTIGPYDIVGLVEAESDERLTRALLELGAQGNVRTTTLRAFSEDDFTSLIA
jgi:uncharacterized protein with GYD domain